MKIVFLDFGGVLSCWNCETRFKLVGSMAFCQSTLDSLNRICEAFGSEVGVVVTSTERYRNSVEYLRDMLTQAGFAYPELVIDKAPVLHSCSGEREEAIIAWLSGRSDVDGFVVLEDDHVMDVVRDHWIKVCSVRGLTKIDADKAIEILNGGITEKLCRTLGLKERVS